MSLQKFAAKGWIRPHKSNRKEIGDLLDIVKRDLKDSASPISPDWRFGIAYNAALKLCTILLYAEGFRLDTKGSHHMRTIAMLPEILGPDRKADADYLDTCRRKRNTVEYNFAGAATDDDAKELIAFVHTLKKDVLNWLELKHQELI